MHHPASSSGMKDVVQGFSGANPMSFARSVWWIEMQTDMGVAACVAQQAV